MDVRQPTNQSDQSELELYCDAGSTGSPGWHCNQKQKRMFESPYLRNYVKVWAEPSTGLCLTMLFLSY